MNTAAEKLRMSTAVAPMSLFERYLTVWVALCIVTGIAAGQWLPGLFQALGRLQVAQVNLPVGLLIWVMIIPMLMKVDFGALHQVRQHWRGIGVTLFVNWAVKPFSMALLGCMFIRHVFAPYLPAAQLDSYVAGLILLAAAPCTAMVFVWSRLDRWRPAIHAVAGGAERHHHGFRLRAAGGVAAGHLVDHRAVGHANHFGRALYRHPRRARAAVAQDAPAGAGQRLSRQLLR